MFLRRITHAMILCVVVLSLTASAWACQGCKEGSRNANGAGGPGQTGGSAGPDNFQRAYGYSVYLLMGGPFAAMAVLGYFSIKTIRRLDAKQEAAAAQKAF
ncbi:MAG: hypothetical protein SFY92_09855 [Verrucomicrobiae bacterium]|nr:hypothetical protein [Verrucomicrobiae bacterium]